jgi:hypothetical protein
VESEQNYFQRQRRGKKERHYAIVVRGVLKNKIDNKTKQNKMIDASAYFR